jgi:hypothetical protein
MWHMGGGNIYIYVCVCACACVRACTVSVGKLQGKRPLERPRCRWQDNININLKEIGRVGMD